MTEIDRAENAGILRTGEHKQLYFPCTAVYQFIPSHTGHYVRKSPVGDLLRLSPFGGKRTPHKRRFRLDNFR